MAESMALNSTRVTFNYKVLYAAMDEQRRNRNLTWQDISREIGVAASTIVKTGDSGHKTMEADGVWAMVQWVGQTMHYFTRNAKLTAPPTITINKGELRRFDTTAFYAALDEQRRARGWTWQQLAHEIGGFSPAMLTRLTERGRMGVSQVVILADWLGQPAENFTYIAKR